MILPNITGNFKRQKMLEKLTLDGIKNTLQEKLKMSQRNENINQDFALYTLADFYLYNSAFKQVNFLTTKSLYKILADNKSDYPILSDDAFKKLVSHFNEEINSVYFENFGNPVGQKALNNQKEQEDQKMKPRYKKMFYCRIISYLCLSPISAPASPDSKAVIDIKHFNASPYFFPLLIGLIHAHKKNDWIKLKNDVLYTARLLLTEPHDALSDLSIYDPDVWLHLYSYWLDLCLPDKLYEICKQIESIYKTVAVYPEFSLHKTHLCSFFDRLKEYVFMTCCTQNNFYDSIIQTLSLFENQIKNNLKWKNSGELKPDNEFVSSYFLPKFHKKYEDASNFETYQQKKFIYLHDNIIESCITSIKQEI